MEIIEKKVSELIPYDRNPRLNESAVEFVKASIKEFGFKNPIIIDKDNVIVAGHTRLLASKELGLKTVPCIIADDLTDDQIKAFRLADNKTAEFSAWDFELLNSELEDIEMDLSQFGFETESFDFEGGNLEFDDSSEPKERNYSIAYELVFSNEEEQERWYKILRSLRVILADEDTIAQRVITALEGWLESHES